MGSTSSHRESRYQKPRVPYPRGAVRCASSPENAGAKYTQIRDVRQNGMVTIRQRLFSETRGLPESYRLREPCFRPTRRIPCPLWKIVPKEINC